MRKRTKKSTSEFAVKIENLPQGTVYLKSGQEIVGRQTFERNRTGHIYFSDRMTEVFIQWGKVDPSGRISYTRRSIPYENIDEIIWKKEEFSLGDEKIEA